MSELTPMQAACWFGRISESEFLGGVAAHLYVEFDGQSIDLQKLESALQHMHLRHSILRMRLSSDGIPTIAESVPKTLLEIDDLSVLTAQNQVQYLEDKREQWTHQQLDLTSGQTARYSVSLINQSNFRLHIDTDMIAVDPSSFCQLIEDLAACYQGVVTTTKPVVCFFDWYEAMQADASIKQRHHRDKTWWRARLPDIAPMPSLPVSDNAAKTAQSHCLSERLTSVEYKVLRQLARQRKITFSSMMLGLFAFALSQATQDTFFRLNVPTFWRAPVVEHIDQCIGDFSNFVIVNIDIAAAKTLGMLCQDVANQMIELLDHAHYAGINIMRDLSRYHGAAQQTPVVFTAALDLPQGVLFSENVKQAFGDIIWTTSQGPQVALDAQVVRVENGVLVNWDIRLDTLPLVWVTVLFHSFIGLLREVGQNPAVLDMVFNQLPKSIIYQPELQTCHQSEQPANHKIIMTDEQPLSAIQEAYLLGRTTQIPLGGVAMQEFREYYGRMDMAVLKQRLTDIVKRHESLRTHINVTTLTQYVCNDICINLQEIDLHHLSAKEATTYLQSYRETYTHQMFDLQGAPWNITVFHLTDGFLRLFIRFDALILDGRAIASLMLELFAAPSATTTYMTMPTVTIDTPAETESKAASRAVDMAYWVQKLSNVTNVPALPWIRPLNELGAAHFVRRSLVVPADTFRQLGKIGAKQGLFKNSVIMALILELLSQVQTQVQVQQSIVVAVPVLPLYTGTLVNNSTFIAVEWAVGTKNFIQQASSLQVDVLESLQHLSFSGVDLARLLFEKFNAAPVLPIVITNGLSWPVLTADTPMRLERGLTQTPQVAIDIRFTTQRDGALVFDIDHVPKAIATKTIDCLLQAIDTAIHQMVASQAFHFDVSSYLPVATEQNADVTTTFCQQALFDIYLDTIGQVSDTPVDKTMNFMTIGLRPQHLKTISKRLYDTYAVQLSPAQLLHCRDVSEVQRLLKTG
ncbi:peptide synthetase [Psychrobacter sp. FME5]|nr:peptide synthetase [Psychrobacter sp. FME6]MBE0443731.1 peptide synthetase [Psychrobacter sp. FME5]